MDAVTKSLHLFLDQKGEESTIPIIEENDLAAIATQDAQYSSLCSLFPPSLSPLPQMGEKDPTPSLGPHRGSPFGYRFHNEFAYNRPYGDHGQPPD